MYVTVTTNYIRTMDQLTIIYFVYGLSLNCYYFNNVKSFYLSMLTSRLFRKTFITGLIALLPRQFRPRLRALQADFSVATVTRMKRGDAPRR